MLHKLNEFYKANKIEVAEPHLIIIADMVPTCINIMVTIEVKNDGVD